ncbi:Uncharacterised protein [Mycobacteroides abscessus subsp. massiliense]|nr:Uncharacterised protein [Mycobacteroides abscessus subsp. massiliense]
MVGVATVGDDVGGVCALRLELAQTDLGQRRHLVGRPIESLDGQQDRCAEVDRDAGIGAQLAGARDIGVVTTDDHHGVAALRHRVISVNDLGDCRIRVLVDVVVRDAEAVLIRDIGSALLQQQFQDVVHAFPGPRDGAEHTHTRHRRGQPMHYAQGHRGLSGVPFGRGNVNTRCLGLGHARLSTLGNRSVRILNGRSVR